VGNSQWIKRTNYDYQLKDKIPYQNFTDGKHKDDLQEPR